MTAVIGQQYSFHEITVRAWRYVTGCPASSITTSGMYTIPWFLLYSGITVTWRHSNMVDERGLSVNKANHHELERISLISNAEKLRIHLLNRTEPIVFDGAARQWTCSLWTPEFLASEVGDLRTRFRFCSRANSSANEPSPYKKAIMETDCEFEEASFGEFFQWLNGNIDRSGSLSRFQR